MELDSYVVLIESPDVVHTHFHFLHTDFITQMDLYDVQSRREIAMDFCTIRAGRWVSEGVSVVQFIIKLIFVGYI